MADASTKAVIQSELSTNNSTLNSKINSNTDKITDLQNQIDELTVFESGKIINFYFSNAPSHIIKKGTLNYYLYKIDKLVFTEFTYIGGGNMNNSATLYSEIIETQNDFGYINISLSQNNVTYSITSTYNSVTKKYKYQLKVTSTSTSLVNMPNVALKDVNILT